MAYNINDIDEKTRAEIRKKLGLDAPETPKNSWFQGDFGTSIKLSEFITSSEFIASLAFLLTVATLLFLFIRRKIRNH